MMLGAHGENATGTHHHVIDIRGAGSGGKGVEEVPPVGKLGQLVFNLLLAVGSGPEGALLGGSPEKTAHEVAYWRRPLLLDRLRLDALAAGIGSQHHPRTAIPGRCRVGE